MISSLYTLTHNKSIIVLILMRMMLRNIEFNRLSNLVNFLELAREEGRMLIQLIKFVKINNKYTYSNTETKFRDDPHTTFYF